MPASVSSTREVRRLAGSRRRVTRPAASIPSRWWLSVAPRIPTASASSLWLRAARVFSASRTSQTGSDPPAAASRSSNARLTARLVRVRTSPIG